MQVEKLTKDHDTPTPTKLKSSRQKAGPQTATTQSADLP